MNPITDKILLEDVSMHEPDYFLRNLIGGENEIRKIITPEKIKDCQKLIDDAREDFFKDEIDTVKKIRKLMENRDASLFSDIAMITLDLKSQAKIFGFGFIGKICSQIIKFIENEQKPINKRCDVILRFLDALDMAMKYRLKDQDGKLERELMLLAESYS